MRPSNRAKSINPHFFAGLNQRLREMRAAGANIIRLDMGSPDTPPDAAIVDSLKESASDVGKHGYGGFGGQPPMRNAIRTYYGQRFGVELDDSELLPLLGSKEGIANMHLAWLDPGEYSLIPNPGYPSYRDGPHLAGGYFKTFDLLPERGWLPDFDSIAADVAHGARMMWLNYPNNPTGGTATLEFFKEAVDFCRQYEILLCHDAPYADVTYDGYRAPSVLEVPGAKEVAIEFNSMSKTYSMAGWRVGMAVGNETAVNALSRVKALVDSGPAKPIQDMTVAALTGDQAWIAPRNELYQSRRDACVSQLRAAGLEVVEPKGAMYVWFRIPAGTTSLAFHTHVLNEAHVSITPGHIYGSNGEGWMRISFVQDIGMIKEAMTRIVGCL